MHRGGMMAKEGRNSIEETIIEAPLTDKELENLLLGFLESLEKEQRLGLAAQTESARKQKESA